MRNGKVKTENGKVKAEVCDRGFDNIGSNRSQAARIQVVPCGLRKDDVVKVEKSGSRFKHT